ncbi:hypothetical protein [Synechococcus sp. UW140]|uniref:hypothetical protein n=1 Tax=Synechococcus sp. UW140 TaxID=368503 RepID=UPI0031383D2F
MADSRLILDRAKAILKLNPGFRVLVQTDQAQIRSFFCGALGNAAFYLDEMPVTEGEAVIHKTLDRNRLNFSQTLLSVVLIASDCRHVLLTSSNVSNWVVFFRGSDQGIELF